MDKQLIERIALEVAKDYLKFKFGDRKGLDIYDLDLDDEDLKPLIAEIERECADSFMQFLTRIDAERSKKAAAWFINVNDECDPDHPLYQQISKGFEGCLGTFPLFRSPTIPEGMAKDAERYRFIRMNRLWLKANLPLIAAPAFDEAIDAGLLTAAQGERNAD